MFLKKWFHDWFIFCPFHTSEFWSGNFLKKLLPPNKKLWGPLESTLINFKAGSRKLSERKRSYFILLVLCGKQVHNCLHVSFSYMSVASLIKLIVLHIQDKIVDVRKGRGKKFDTGEPCLLHWNQQKSSKLRNVKKKKLYRAGCGKSPQRWNPYTNIMMFTKEDKKNNCLDRD